MEAPGKIILQVTSVLFIIFGVFITVLFLIAVLGSTLVASIGGVLGIFGGVLLAASIILLISSILGLVQGFIGLRKCGDPAQANFFIVNGFVLCALMLASMLIVFQFTGLIGFALPVLYIIGGYMNKNAAR